MKFLPFRYRSIFLMAIFSILSCKNDDDPGIIYETIIESDYAKSIKSNTISGQLTSILGLGDHFEINHLEEFIDVLPFETVHEFYYYKNDHVLLFNSELIYNNGYHSTRLKDILNETSSINIMIDQKLDHEDHLQHYIIKNILSGLHGNTLGKSWEQTNYHYAVLNGTAIIDLFGEIHYRISIADLGIEFIDSRHYKMQIDIHTGTPLSFLDVDE